MKQIVAIVKPFLAEKVLEGLKRAPLEACSVREVKGYGRQKSYLDQYAESEYSLAFLPKVEITLWVDEAGSKKSSARSSKSARTGRMGDGKISSCRRRRARKRSIFSGSTGWPTQIASNARGTAVAPSASSLAHDVPEQSLEAAAVLARVAMAVVHEPLGRGNHRGPAWPVRAGRRAGCRER